MQEYFLFIIDGEHKIYISSGDWMTRNFDRRIEICCPIYDNDIQKEILRFLSIQLQDNCKARIITKDNKYLYLKRLKGDREVRSQEALYQYLKKN